MLVVEYLRDGPLESKPDTTASGPPSFFGELAFANEGPDWEHLVERVGVWPATWMWAWSPHHIDFNPAGLSFERTVHEHGPYIWVESARKFAAMTGTGGYILVTVQDRVQVFRHRPWAGFAAIVASATTRPSLDEIVGAFQGTGAGRVLKGQADLQRGDPDPRALERWRPPELHDDEARFFVRLPGDTAIVEIVVDVADQTVSLELLE